MWIKFSGITSGYQCLHKKYIFEIIPEKFDQKVWKGANHLKTINWNNYVGGRSFSQITPMVWNSLPADLKVLPSLPIFKARLKTHLFTEYFGSLSWTLVLCFCTCLNYMLSTCIIWMHVCLLTKIIYHVVNVMHYFVCGILLWQESRLWLCTCAHLRVCFLNDPSVFTVL